MNIHVMAIQNGRYCQCLSVDDTAVIGRYHLQDIYVTMENLCESGI